MSEKMPRELDSVAAEFRHVPPPPTPELPDPYRFRVADPDVDAATISEWMNRPHLVATWRYDRSPSEWAHHLSAQLGGTFSRPLIASQHGRDFAYVEIFRAARDQLASAYDADPHDIGVHAAIADLSDVHQGHAHFLGPFIAASVFQLDPQCRRMVFDFEPFNAPARSFLERFGCVYLGEHEMPNRRIALYALPRSPDDVPRARDAS